MATVEIPARDFAFHLNTGTVGVPVWTEVEGLNNWTHSPQSNDADTTKFSDDGRQAHMKISRGDEFALKGQHLEDPDTGDRAPGQEAVEAWADEIGYASRKQFRITSPGGNTATFEATATVTTSGGGNDDVTSWEVAVKVSGAITRA